MNKKEYYRTLETVSRIIGLVYVILFVISFYIDVPIKEFIFCGIIVITAFIAVSTYRILGAIEDARNN